MDKITTVAQHKLANDLHVECQGLYYAIVYKLFFFYSKNTIDIMHIDHTRCISFYILIQKDFRLAIGSNELRSELKAFFNWDNSYKIDKIRPATHASLTFSLKKSEIIEKKE